MKWSLYNLFFIGFIYTYNKRAHKNIHSAYKDTKRPIKA